jgi:hypothetical protein
MESPPYHAAEYAPTNGYFVKNNFNNKSEYISTAIGRQRANT